MNSQQNHSYAAAAAAHWKTVAQSDIDARLGFIRRTYAHLAGAIALFIGLETLLFVSGLWRPMVETMVGSRFSWFIVLGAFILVGNFANRWAMNPRSKPMQYMGLGLYVLLEAIIFMPMIALGLYKAPSAIMSAAVVTLLVFAALTAFVFVTKQDFSFLRSGLMVAGFLALGGVGVSLLFGFTLGIWFSVFMIGLAAGYILYYTSNVLKHYGTDQHVAAALALFSAVALMFWYVLRLFLRSR